MRYNKLILGLIMLLVIPQMHAIAVVGGAAGAAAASAANAEHERQLQQDRVGTSCYPPLEFSKKYNCALEYRDDKVNQYDCGFYVVTGDCEGGVLSYYDDSWTTGESIGIALLIVGIILLVFFLIWISS